MWTGHMIRYHFSCQTIPDFWRPSLETTFILKCNYLTIYVSFLNLPLLVLILWPKVVRVGWGSLRMFNNFYNFWNYTDIWNAPGKCNWSEAYLWHSLSSTDWLRKIHLVLQLISKEYSLWDQWVLSPSQGRVEDILDVGKLPNMVTCRIKG